MAGALIRVVGAPLALLVDAVLLVVSATILRGIVIHEAPRASTARLAGRTRFWRDLKAGVDSSPAIALLVALAVVVGIWQMCHHAAMVVQILFATRTLGLGEQAIGLCYTGMGVGTILASVFGNRISRRIGPGRASCSASRSAVPAGCCCRSRRRARSGVAPLRADADAVFAQARCWSSSISWRCARP